LWIFRLECSNPCSNQRPSRGGEDKAALIQRLTHTSSKSGPSESLALCVRRGESASLYPWGDS